MSRTANPGALRTCVRFVRIVRGTDEEGFPREEEVNVFGEGKSVRVKWVNAHGTDAFTAMQMQLREPATVTCRYSPKIDARCLVYKGSDTEPYEIISIDNVEERGAWMEIKVRRREAAR